ncbi:hypothetical protein HYT57_00675 [Candidatus Woesearchaeota archaeon]|nr:hypothetical protein [Candidatus Woesearchaeota archaeon]
MNKRIFTLFVLMLFLTPSVAFAQESVPDSGGGGDGGSTSESGGGGAGGDLSGGGSGSSDSGSSTDSGGTGEGGSVPSSGGGGEGGFEGEPRDSDAPQPPTTTEGSFEQKTCPKDMCMKGEECVPCSSSGDTRTSCPSTPPNKCASDQSVEAVFDNNGCVIDHKCGPSGSGRPRFDSVPPGCHVEKGEFGDFVKCDKRDDGFGDMEKKCRSDGGRLHKTEKGPECLFDNRGQGGGFFGAPKCPENLQEIEQRCSSSGGNPEKFIDRSGCKIVSCGFGSGQENFEGVADDPRECESRGGDFVLIKGEPRCFTGEDQVRIKEKLDEIEPTDLLKIALRLENILKSLEEIGDSFEDLKNFYEKRGDAEKAASFERALTKIDGAAARLDEIKFGLAEKAGDITEEDRYQVIRDIKDIKNIMQDIAVDILTGGRSSRSEKRGRGSGDEFDRDFEDEGIDFMNAIRQCEDYSEEEPYSFSPDKEVNVELRGLRDGKCIMAITPPGGFVGTVEFLLPPKTYQFFDGPHLLLSPDVDCSPKDACAMMRKFIESEDKGRRPTERFGEKERMEPKECKDAGATGEKCFDLMFIKLGPPPECRGLSLQECKEKTFRNPEERRDEFRQEFRAEFEDGEFREEFREDFRDGEFRQESRNEFRMPPECKGLSPEECKNKFSGGEFREDFRQDFGDREFREPTSTGDFKLGENSCHSDDPNFNGVIGPDGKCVFVPVDEQGEGFDEPQPTRDSTSTQSTEGAT